MRTKSQVQQDHLLKSIRLRISFIFVGLQARDLKQSYFNTRELVCCCDLVEVWKYSRQTRFQ